MCIFNSETLAKKTKILSAWVQPGRQLLAYQNQVKTGPEYSVMLLPLPTTDLGTIAYHDTTGYSNFLDEIAEKIVKSEGWRSAEVHGLVRVGQYQLLLTSPVEVLSELEFIGAPIPKWMSKMIKSYGNWSWLLCIMDPNSEMKSQPLMLEFDSVIPDLYYPMMEVHGPDNPEPTVNRDHVLIVGDVAEKNPVSSGTQYPGYPYPEMKFFGMSVFSRGANGDAFASLSPRDTDATYYDFRIESKYE